MKTELLVDSTENNNSNPIGFYSLVSGLLCQLSNDSNIKSIGKGLTWTGGIITIAQILNSTLESQEKNKAKRIWENKKRWNDLVTLEIHDPRFGKVEKFLQFTYSDYWHLSAFSHFKNYIIQSEKKKLVLDCADLVLRGLLDFAYKYKLPFHISDDFKANKDPDFNNRTGYYIENGRKRFLSSYTEFRKSIELKYGSQDIYRNNKILMDVPLSKILPGDILSYKYPGTNWYHAQVVVRVNKDSVTVVQGNLESHGGEASPVEMRNYELDDIKNKTVGGFLFWGDRPDDIKVRRWRFSYFDSFFK